ncbi:unnamed protein product [Rotaria sp. Silwood1]|nr:unnamed protein product [Rotaria sp. Silwood1]
MGTLEENQYVREGRVHVQLDIARTYDDKHMIKLAAHEFIVYSNVFSLAVFPLYDTIVKTWLHLIRTIKPESVLEIGCGAGYLAILAALNGANRVTATDRTEDAVNNIQASIEKYNLGDQMRAVYGSGFEPFDKNDQFDVIFWNIPLSHIDKLMEKLNTLERTVFDSGNVLCEAYLKDAREHLTDTGRLFMTFLIGSVIQKNYQS